MARFKAFRDVPLPYELEEDPRESLHPEETLSPVAAEITAASSPALSRDRSRTSVALALEAQESPTAGMRRRANTRTFTSMLANAHTQDFEKKRKPRAGDDDNVANLKRDGSFGDEDEGRAGSSDDEDFDEQDVEALLREPGPREEEGRVRERNL